MRVLNDGRSFARDIINPLPTKHELYNVPNIALHLAGKQWRFFRSKQRENAASGEVMIVDSVYESLKPHTFFAYFRQISNIPREMKNIA